MQLFCWCLSGLVLLVVEIIKEYSQLADAPLKKRADLMQAFESPCTSDRLETDEKCLLWNSHGDLTLV